MKCGTAAASSEPTLRGFSCYTASNTVSCDCGISSLHVGCSTGHDSSFAASSADPNATAATLPLGSSHAGDPAAPSAAAAAAATQPSPAAIDSGNVVAIKDGLWSAPADGGGPGGAAPAQPAGEVGAGAGWQQPAAHVQLPQVLAATAVVGAFAATVAARFLPIGAPPAEEKAPPAGRGRAAEASPA